MIEKSEQKETSISPPRAKECFQGHCSMLALVLTLPNLHSKLPTLDRWPHLTLEEDLTFNWLDLKLHCTISDPIYCNVDLYTDLSHEGGPVPLPDHCWGYTNKYTQFSQHSYCTCYAGGAIYIIQMQKPRVGCRCDPAQPHEIPAYRVWQPSMGLDLDDPKPDPPKDTQIHILIRTLEGKSLCLIVSYGERIRTLK